MLQSTMEYNCSYQGISTTLNYIAFVIQRRTGHNVYGVVRAHRATGVESMLFAVDMRDQAAVAMMMSFASYARGFSFLSFQSYIGV